MTTKMLISLEENTQINIDFTSVVKLRDVDFTLINTHSVHVDFQTSKSDLEDAFFT